jgi:glycosyltransferase involved in cell wall biosynthesis
VSFLKLSQTGTALKLSESANPLVSIITPSYNQVQFLEGTIRSVLGQDYAPIEYILIDGGSTDGSLEIIQRYSGHFSSWVSEIDQGQVDAINKGLRKANGEIVAWINSDDLYMAGAVREAVKTLQQHPEVGMVYADGIMVDAEGKLLDRHTYRTYDVIDLLCFEVLLQPTVFMRRDVLQAVGYLSDDYDLILDHELWVRFADHSPILHVPSFWAVERTHESAKTIAQASAFVHEAEKMIEKAEESHSLGTLITREHSLIYASLHAFAARRLIDAGEHRLAVQHLIKTLKLDTRVFLKYWYKAIQACGSALGLESLFLFYRRSRRKMQHGTARIVISQNGAELAGK